MCKKNCCYNLITNLFTQSHSLCIEFDSEDHVNSKGRKHLKMEQNIVLLLFLASAMVPVAKVFCLRYKYLLLTLSFDYLAPYHNNSNLINNATQNLC